MAISSKKLKVVLTGGGTGGHVYPCLSIYNILSNAGFIQKALYIGIKGRAEELIVPRTGIPLEFVESAPLANGTLIKKLPSLFIILKGMLSAGRKLLTFKPNLVIATGGYASAPVLFSAFLLKPFLKLTIVMEEQNFVPGLLNKVGSVLADVVLVNFQKSAYFTWSKKVVYVGYPLRDIYLSSKPERANLRKKHNIPANAFLVLITGGSLGARSINQVVCETISELAKLKDIYIVHSIGTNASSIYNAVNDTRKKLKQKLGERFDDKTFQAKNENANVFYQGFPFIHEIYDFQIAADLIISRAGAGAIAELIATGKASILIPKRGLPGDHQELNAINIAEHDCCNLLIEKRDSHRNIDYIPADDFIKSIKNLYDNSDRLGTLAKNIYSLRVHNSDKKILRTIQNIIKKKPVNYIDEIIEPRFVKFQRSFDQVISYLDKVRQKGQMNNPYLHFYSLKVDEYIKSSNFLTVNKGLKLIGALQRTDLYPFIEEHFAEFKGFLKRNSLISLKKAPHYAPFFRDLILAGIDDNYYEVRREAIALIRTFYTNFYDDKIIIDAIRHRLMHRFESFEVRGEAIKALVLLLSDKDFFKVANYFIYSRKVRIREAILLSIVIGLEAGTLKNDDKLKMFLKTIFVTTSEFKPDFKIKENYLSVLKKLEGMENA